MHLLPALGVMTVGSLLIRASFTRQGRQQPTSILIRILGFALFGFGIFYFVKTAGFTGK